MSSLLSRAILTINFSPKSPFSSSIRLFTADITSSVLAALTFKISNKTPSSPSIIADSSKSAVASSISATSFKNTSSFMRATASSLRFLASKSLFKNSSLRPFSSFPKGAFKFCVFKAVSTSLAFREYLLSLPASKNILT